MAVLSDRDIRERLRSGRPGVYFGISPCEDHQVQPASIDLTLANEWRVYSPLEGYCDEYRESGEYWDPIPIDMLNVKAIKTRKINSNSYTLHPHELVLCSTVEYVDMPHDLQGAIYGKSSLARLGLLVHLTAGFIDPGFKGKITLEMYNLNKRPIILRTGKPICQLSMTKLSSPAEKPYGHPDLNSHYQDQTEVQGSLYDG